MKFLKTCFYRSGNSSSCCEMGYIYCKALGCTDYKTDPETVCTVTEEEQAKATGHLHETYHSEARLTQSIIQTDKARESSRQYKERGKEMEQNGEKPKRKYTRHPKPEPVQEPVVEAKQPGAGSDIIEFIPPDLTAVPWRIMAEIAKVIIDDHSKRGKDWKQGDIDFHRNALMWLALGYINDPDGVIKETGVSRLAYLAATVAYLCELEAH